MKTGPRTLSKAVEENQSAASVENMDMFINEFRDFKVKRQEQIEEFKVKTLEQIEELKVKTLELIKELKTLEQIEALKTLEQQIEELKVKTLEQIEELKAILQQQSADIKATLEIIMQKTGSKPPSNTVVEDISNDNTIYYISSKSKATKQATVLSTIAREKGIFSDVQDAQYVVHTSGEAHPKIWNPLFKSDKAHPKRKNPLFKE